MHPSSTPRTLLAIMLVLGTTGRLAAAAGDEHWHPLAHFPGPNGTIQCAIRVGDGYAIGGSFTAIGDRLVPYLALGQGDTWTAVGGGTDGEVRLLAADGRGGLYACGRFNNAGGLPAPGLAHYDGAGWEALPASPGTVRCIAVDTAGRLVLGGAFTINSVHRAVLRLEDGRWVDLGLAGYATTLLAAGDRLHAEVGGDVWILEGPQWRRIADFNGGVYALVETPDGGLVAGGSFTREAAAGAVNHVARWDGGAWSPLGAGLGGQGAGVTALTVDPSGRLLGAHQCQQAHCSVWDGQAWQEIGASEQHGCAITALIPVGTALAAFGNFLDLGGCLVRGAAVWAANAWTPLFNLNPERGQIQQAVVDGRGRIFALAHGVGWDTILWRITGETWERVFQWDDYYLAWHLGMAIGRDDALYLWGWGTNPVVSGGDAWILRLDDQGFIEIPGDFGGGGLIHCLAFDASGNLYAGGHLFDVDGIAVNNVARWDGRSWSALGGGVTSSDDDTAVVDCMAIGPDDSLYVGGSITHADGIDADLGLARWCDGRWEALPGPGDDWHTCAIAIHSPERIAVSLTGSFGVRSGGLGIWGGEAWIVFSGPLMPIAAYRRLATDRAGNIYLDDQRWDGAAPVTLGSGLVGSVKSLAYDGCGNRLLYAGGFSLAGGRPAAGLACYDLAGSVPARLLRCRLAAQQPLPGIIVDLDGQQEIPTDNGGNAVFAPVNRDQDHVLSLSLPVNQ